MFCPRPAAGCGVAHTRLSAPFQVKVRPPASLWLRGAVGIRPRSAHPALLRSGRLCRELLGYVVAGSGFGLDIA